MTARLKPGEVAARQGEGPPAARLRPARDGHAALAQRYAPVVYGRDLPEIPGRFENARTDVPLLGYHTVERDGAGNTTLEYTIVWSNEDGGTDTPPLMARWGRTTDIEWIYRVTLGPGGNVISELYQAPDHAELPYTGARIGRHPLLRTGTSNNNMVPVTNPRQGYRFFPDVRRTLPAGRAREAVMDANPWTYRVMAEEMIREGKVEATPSPATPEMSDQRDYLFAEFDKDTSYPVPAPPGSWVGTALQVKLAGDPTWYSSNHGVADWSIEARHPRLDHRRAAAGQGRGRRGGRQGGGGPGGRRRRARSGRLPGHGHLAQPRLPPRAGLPARRLVPAGAAERDAQPCPARGRGLQPPGRVNWVPTNRSHIPSVISRRCLDQQTRGRGHPVAILARGRGDRLLDRLGHGRRARRRDAPAGPSRRRSLVDLPTSALNSLYGPPSPARTSAAAVAENSVRISPGWITATSTPKPLTSKRSASLIASTAYLVAW